MMGWVTLLALFVVSLGLLWVIGVRRGMLTAAAAALMLGATGYALQGSPAEPAAPAVGEQVGDIQVLTGARHAFFGNFSPAESWMLISEALARSGNTEDAVGILQNAARRYPGDVQIWIGLGNALVDHGHGLTPPAEYAYRRAAELAPGHPAPRFFYDLALIRSGNTQAAVRDLIALMRQYPNASWRPMVGSLVLTVINNGEPKPTR
jgi:cytochrome c-type biogenesis protein CcmH